MLNWMMMWYFRSSQSGCHKESMVSNLSNLISILNNLISNYKFKYKLLSQISTVTSIWSQEILKKYFTWIKLNIFENSKF